MENALNIVSKSLTAQIAKHSLFMLMAVTSTLVLRGAPVEAQTKVLKPHQVDALIITGPGGHNLAADNIQKRLSDAHMTWARFDFSTLSAWTFEQTIEMLEKTPEQANEFYRNYYELAKKAKRPGELPQGEWHSNEQLMSVLNLVRPRVVLSTYAIATETFDRLKMQNKLSGLPYGSIPTDVSSEPYWTHLLPSAADHVFPPSPDWQSIALAAGIPADHMTLTGIPGNPKAESQLNEAQVANLWKSLNLDPSLTTVFISGGSGGVGTFGPMLESIRSQFGQRPDRNVQIVFATGSSAKNFELVQAARASMPPNVHLEALGYTHDLPQYMNYVADIVVSKAGGLTTSEIARATGMKNGRLREGRPLLLTLPAYGIEPGNAEYFINEGMAAPTLIETLGSNILNLIDHPEVQASMMAKQQKIRSSYAPEKIIGWAQNQLTKPDQVVIAEQNPSWISEKLNDAAKNPMKKPLLTVSDLSNEELRKIASKTAEYASKKDKIESDRLAARRMVELRKTYPRREPAKGTQPFQIAITIDDLPGGTGGYGPGQRLSTVKRMIDILHGHGITNAYGFVNSINIKDWQEVEQVMREWQKAGFELGNHTHAHTGLQNQTAEEFIQEIEKTDEYLAELGIPKDVRRVFRFPMLQEGNSREKREKVRKYFADNGYRVAPVTVNTHDFMSNGGYDRAGEDQAAKAAAVSKGIEVASHDLTNAKALSARVFGRDINHVLLLHLAEINVDMLDGILADFEKRGAVFVSVDQALKDPAYSIDHGQVSQHMGSFLEEMAYAEGYWTPEEGRQMKFAHSTIQKRISAVRRTPLMCRDLFRNVALPKVN